MCDVAQVELAMQIRSKQKGVALLMFVFVLVFAIIGVAIYSLNAVDIQHQRSQKTADALAEAKAALIGYAVSQDLTAVGCGNNCARPGDLLCPDLDNDGDAEGACGSADGTTGQANRLGRLPWRTLDVADLRDGDGERLWYAVSNKYKNNTRFLPLNSDTTATITLRDSNGNVIFDGANGGGVVAVIIAPGSNLVRQDLVSQVRSLANQNTPLHYLDIAFGEDNQDFLDEETNGFIMGPVKNAAGDIVLNDRVIAITRGEMIQAMESRVLAEVRTELINYFTLNSFYPYPALFNDASCLGSADLALCPEDAATLNGRMPVTLATPWNANSIFRGTSNGNWFQLNAWREVIHYAVAPACVPGTLNCTGGGGMLTLNNATTLPVTNKEFIVLASGASLAGQDRTLLNRTFAVNYLEGENIIPMDNIYTRTIPITNAVNDRAASQP